MSMIKRKADLSDYTIRSSPSQDDSKKGTGTTGKFYRVGGFLCFMGLFAVVVTHNGESSDLDAMGFRSAILSKNSDSNEREGAKESGGVPSPMDDYPALEWAFSKYENCVVSWSPPPPKTEWDTKPLWLPAFPGSGNASPTHKGDIIKPLINGITGLKAGGKNFHASSKTLKRCKGVDETATCAQAHPVVGTSPEKQTDNFYHSIILMVRNIRTAFPVHVNEKSEAYHSATEQISENGWRNHRDHWHTKVFEEWKSVITTWKEMEEYDVGAYLQYEELMDPERGPVAVQRIADLLQTAGFSVAPQEDLTCIWFKIVKGEYLRLKEYCKHIYGYTKEQQAYFLRELESFKKEVADDPKLVAILQEYYEDIKDNMYIDPSNQQG